MVWKTLSKLKYIIDTNWTNKKLGVLWYEIKSRSIVWDGKF